MSLKIKNAVKKMLDNDIAQPELAEVAAHFFDIVGGPRKVALLLHTELLDAKPGTLIRARILDLVLRITKTPNSRKSNEDSSLMSDEDLEKRVNDILSKRA